MPEEIDHEIFFEEFTFENTLYPPPWKKKKDFFLKLQLGTGGRFSGVIPLQR